MEENQLVVKYNIQLRNESDSFKIMYRLYFIYQSQGGQDQPIFKIFIDESLIQLEYEDLFRIGLRQTPLSSSEFQNYLDTQINVFNPYLRSFIAAYKQLVNLQLQQISTKIFDPLANFLKEINHKILNLELLQDDSYFEIIDDIDLEGFWDCLGNFTNLVNLKIDLQEDNLSIPFLSSKSLNAISKLSNLQIFYFRSSRTYSENDSFQEIGECLENLVNLEQLTCYICYEEIVGNIPQFAKSLSTLTKLKSLDITIQKMNSEYTVLKLFKGISKLVRLERLQLYIPLEIESKKEFQIDVNKYLSQLVKLKVLDIDFENSYGEMFKGLKFSEALKSLTNIVEFQPNFNKENFTQKDMLDTIFSYQFLINLRKLNLHFSHISLRNDELMNQFNLSFSKLVNLDSFKMTLINVDMNEQDLLKLNDSISSFQKLSFLQYSLIKMSQIQFVGYQSIGQLLKKQKNLKSLSLGFHLCYLNDEQFLEIKMGYASLIQLNTFIFSVDENILLTQNSISKVFDSIESLSKMNNLYLNLEGSTHQVREEKMLKDQLSPIIRNKSIRCLNLYIGLQQVNNFLKRKMINTVIIN